MLLVNCKSRSLSIDGDEMACKYFSEIRKFKTLTDGQQKDLLYIIKNATKSESDMARCKLVECNQRFVASIAKHLTNGVNFTDLVSEGTIGLNKAIDKFKLSFNQKFLTYAVFWIKKYMIDYIIGDSKMVVTKNANKVYAYVSTKNNKFFLENGRYPTIEELQDILAESGIIFPNKNDLIQPTIVSVDEIDPDYCDNDSFTPFKQTLLQEYEKHTSINDIENKINSEHIKTIANSMLNYLTDKQRFIIERFYGIGCHPENFHMIANALQTTSRNVSSEYNKAINKIRKKIGLEFSTKK